MPSNTNAVKRRLSKILALRGPRCIAKIDCTAQPAWKAGKIVLGQKLKLNTEKAAAKRDEKKGRQDIFITPNCTVMKQILKPGARLPTCRRCWLTATRRLHFKEMLANRLQEIIVLAEPGGKGCVKANPVLLMPSSKLGRQQLNMRMLSSSMQPKIDSPLFVACA